MDDIDRDPELRALGELCRSLARNGIRNVQLRDALPALAVITGPPGVGFYVFVSGSGRYFTWCTADQRHPISDVDGAAAKISELARRQTEIGIEARPVRGGGGT